MNIIEDLRRIVCLTLINGNEYKVGQCQVSEIESYRENGQYCDLPFFKVYVGGEIRFRINAAAVSEIEYPPFFQKEVHK